MLHAVRRARLMAVALAGVWLWMWAGTAVAQTTSTTYLDADLGQKLEDLGRVHEDATRGLKSGARQVISDPSGRGVPVLTEIIKVTQVFSTQSLQPTGNPNTSGGGTNISRDGNCVVGFQDNGFFTFLHAFRWTEPTGSVDLGTLDPSNNASRSSFATDTNQDCSVVVGLSDVTANGATQHAFRWTSGGMVDLGAPANGGPNSRAFGVTSNGAVVVGDADFPDPNNLISGKSRKAFRWTQASGFQNLGDLQPAGLAIATAVTGDGTVVVGQASVSNGSRAFRWITPTPPAQPVMQPIGPLSGHTHAAATAVSDNGKIIAGISHPTFLQYQGVVLGWNQGTAFRWTQATGIQELRQVLADNGIDMTGITLVSVTGMSPDGQWIQGAATTAQTGPNETVAFIAQVCDDDIGGPCSTAGAATFTLGAAPNQLTVSAGNSGSTTITVTPNAGFAQPVSFSCGNLPVGAACSFNPATVTPAGAPINTTLTITTNGGPVAMISPVNSPTMFAYALTPVGLMLTGALWYRRRADTHMVWMALLLISVIAMASCSSSDSTPPATNSGGGIPATGTPAGTSTVSVTASSGGSSSGLPITLTVTR
jgi:probable HAF family extracellular repeat protein